MKKDSISRRIFIQKSSLAAGTLAAGSTLISSCSPDKSKTDDTDNSNEQQALTGLIPTREFGKTGDNIGILGYGGGSQFMKMPDGEWEPHMELALK